MGTADGAVHDRREGRKRQHMLLIFTEAAHRFGIALLVFGGSRPPASAGRPPSFPVSRCRPVRWNPLAARAWEVSTQNPGLQKTRETPTVKGNETLLHQRRRT